MQQIIAFLLLFFWHNNNQTKATCLNVYFLLFLVPILTKSRTMFFVEKQFICPLKRYLLHKYVGIGI